MRRNPEAYVDSSAFIAFLDRSDSHHESYRILFASPPALVTTPLVVAETQAWFLRRYDGFRALQFLAMIEALTPLTILDIGADDLSAATGYLRRLGDQALTMTDAMGLHLMAKRRTKVCWSTDRHLGLTGVALVTSP